MARAFKPNPRGLRQFEREVQASLNKMHFTMPITATPVHGQPISPPLPDDQDRLLKALYDRRAFVNDISLDTMAEDTGLSETSAKAALQSCMMEQLVAGNGYAGGGHLTDAGRHYVVERRGPQPAAPPGGPVNHFHGPTQYATGPGSSQTMTNNISVDTTTLAALITAVGSLDVGSLTGEERSELEADLQVLNTQLDSPAEIPGYRRALRTVQATGSKIGVSAAGSTISRLIGEHADVLLAAL